MALPQLGQTQLEHRHGLMGSHAHHPHIPVPVHLTALVIRTKWDTFSLKVRRLTLEDVVGNGCWHDHGNAKGSPVSVLICAAPLKESGRLDEPRVLGGPSRNAGQQSPRHSVLHEQLD